MIDLPVAGLALLIAGIGGGSLTALLYTISNRIEAHNRRKEVR